MAILAHASASARAWWCIDLRSSSSLQGIVEASFTLLLLRSSVVRAYPHSAEIDTKIYSHVWKAPTQAIKYQRFQRTIILWRLGRCVIIQIFNELLVEHKISIFNELFNQMKKQKNLSYRLRKVVHPFKSSLKSMFLPILSLPGVFVV